LWNALNGGFDGEGGQVIGAYILEYALVGSPNRSAYRTHNNCFCHELILLISNQVQILTMF
jgi:hypothetical protein